MLTPLSVDGTPDAIEINNFAAGLKHIDPTLIARVLTTVPIASPICGRRPPVHNGYEPSGRATRVLCYNIIGRFGADDEGLQSLRPKA